MSVLIASCLFCCWPFPLDAIMSVVVCNVECIVGKKGYTILWRKKKATW